MTSYLDAIDAFADGESVAAADLEAALAHEDARAYLIDVLALRGVFGGAVQLTSAGRPFRAAVHAGPKGPAYIRYVAAAALIIFGTAAGFIAGRSGRTGTDPAQPVPTVVVTGGETAPRTTAPAPTHVYRMENGVNWNEKAGGN